VNEVGGLGEHETSHVFCFLVDLLIIFRFAPSLGGSAPIFDDLYIIGLTCLYSFTIYM